MLIRDDKEYRNIQQQVAKNTSDIEELKEGSGFDIDAYTKAESDAKFQTKTAMSDYYTKTATDDKFQTQDGMSLYATTSSLNSKQDTLVSGTNIKTINGNTVLGSGDIIIGEGGTTVTGGTGIIVSNEGEISIDTSVVAELSDIPTVPTKTSQLTNDSGFITGINSTDVTTALGYTPGTSNFSGDYNDLTNKPSIPDMTNYYDKEDVDEIVDNVAEDIPEVIANPVTTTATLNSILINGTSYAISGSSAGVTDVKFNGSSVVSSGEASITVQPNPSGVSSGTTLNYLKIGNTNYKIAYPSVPTIPKRYLHTVTITDGSSSPSDSAISDFAIILHWISDSTSTTTSWSTLYSQLDTGWCEGYIRYASASTNNQDNTVGYFNKDTSANKLYFTTVYRGALGDGSYNTYRYLVSSDSVYVNNHSYTQIL